MVEGLRGGGGHEGSPSEKLGSIGDHVRDLQEQGRFGGGITSAENQSRHEPMPGEDNVPEGLTFYPGETSPRSPPDSPSASQGKLGEEGAPRFEDRVEVLRKYTNLHFRAARYLVENYYQLKEIADIDRAILQRQLRRIWFHAAKCHGLQEALDVLENIERPVPEVFHEAMEGRIPSLRDLVEPRSETE